MVDDHIKLSGIDGVKSDYGGLKNLKNILYVCSIEKCMPGKHKNI